ncbi:MAG: hypothetical protein CMN91_08605 [Synechococcus sp. ARS1019]|nr:hypothetical protein [Synechococcus sp. ARS1019]
MIGTDAGTVLTVVSITQKFFLPAALTDRAVNSRIFELEAEASWNVHQGAALAASKSKDRHQCPDRRSLRSTKPR